MGHTLSALSLATAVALLASPALAQGTVAVACNDEHGSCREDCTLEFGSSARTRAPLGRCLEACSTTHQRCATRWHELQGVQLEPVPAAPAPSPQHAASVAPPARAPAPETEDPPAPASVSAAPDASRTRYPAPDPAPVDTWDESPAPSAAPAYRVDTEDYNEGISLPTEAQLAQPAAPAPAPSQARQVREEDGAAAKKKPEPPAVAPKKKPRPGELVEPEYDISDWDPN